MSRIVVIGGSGHVGSYLVPALVERGHEVVNVSRGAAKPYRPHYAWSEIENVSLDRNAEEKAGQFGKKIADLRPDIVVDMIAFDLSSTQQIVEALSGKVEHYLFCSSIWVYGGLTSVPSTENDPTTPIDGYGKGKAESEAWLMREARLTGFPATCFRPGHIVGEGWNPITPQGNANPETFSLIARGDELVLPNLGLEMVHHVHADDVAQWIICAIESRAASIARSSTRFRGRRSRLKAMRKRSIAGSARNHASPTSLLRNGFSTLETMPKTRAGTLSEALATRSKKAASG